MRPPPSWYIDDRLIQTLKEVETNVRKVAGKLDTRDLIKKVGLQLEDVINLTNSFWIGYPSVAVLNESNFRRTLTEFGCCYTLESYKLGLLQYNNGPGQGVKLDINLLHSNLITGKKY